MRNILFPFVVFSAGFVVSQEIPIRPPPPFFSERYVQFGDMPENAMISTGAVVMLEVDPEWAINSNAVIQGIASALPKTGGILSSGATIRTEGAPDIDLLDLTNRFNGLGFTLSAESPTPGIAIGNSIGHSTLGPASLLIQRYPNSQNQVYLDQNGLYFARSELSKYWGVDSGGLYYGDFDGSIWGGETRWTFDRPPGTYAAASMDDIPAIPDTSAFVSRSDSTNLIHDVATSLIGHPYVLQGSTVVPATNAVLTLSGVATDGGAVVNLMPWLATRPSEVGSTGTLHIATAPDTFIVDVSGDIRVTQPEYGSIPKDNFPVEWSSSRVDDTNWMISAWAPGEVSTYEPKSGQGYYATISNLVVHTYNRRGYWPNTLTNDTAALPFFVDSFDVTRAPARRAVNSGSLRDYVTSRKREIAASAWRLTPSGKDSPSPNFVTLDLPLVQQGNIAFLQQGDYYVMSYEGGDWRTSTEGSSWQIGASGRADLTITSEGRMAFIRDFSVAGQVATIYCATNWMGGAASSNGVPAGADPYVEFSGSMDNPQWLACQDCTRAYIVDAANGDYWLFQAPATEPRMFYRVVIPGGERRIIAGPTLRLNAGIEVGGVRYDLVTITNGLEVFEVVGRRVAP